MANTAREYFPVLDGMRGIAAILVVVLHAVNPFGLTASVVPHAHLSVDFFFALSGFVVAHAYERKLEAGMPLLEFVVQRAIRLGPMILFGLGLGVSVYGLKILIQNRPDLVQPMVVTALLNAILLPSPYLVDDEHGGAWPLNPPSWSLAFEVMINLVYALVLYRLRGALLAILLVCAGLAVVVIGLVNEGVEGGHRWDDASSGFVRVLFPFLIGAWLWRVRPAVARERAKRTGILPCVVLALALVAPVPDYLRGPYEVAVVLVFAPLLVYYGSNARRDPSLEPLLLWLGRISYPLYAIHYPIIKVVSYATRRFAIEDASILMVIAVVEVVLCVGLAHCVTRWIDEPLRGWLMRAWRNRRRATFRCGNASGVRPNPRVDWPK